MCFIQDPWKAHLQIHKSNNQSTVSLEQAGFCHRKSNVDQTTFPTQDIKDSFTEIQMAGAVFIDLTVAYDTVWYLGLTSLAPLFYKMIFQHWPPKKYAYADDLALLHTAGD